MSSNVAGAGISFNSISQQAATPPVTIPGADQGITFDAIGNVYQLGSDVQGNSVITEPRYIVLDAGVGVNDAVIDLLAGIGNSRFLFGTQGGTTDVIRFEANNIGSAAVTSYDIQSSALVRDTTSAAYAEVWQVNGTNTNTLVLQQDASSGILLQNLYPGIGMGNEGDITLRWRNNGTFGTEGVKFKDSSGLDRFTFTGGDATGATTMNILAEAASFINLFMVKEDFSSGVNITMDVDANVFNIRDANLGTNLVTIDIATELTEFSGTVRTGQGSLASAAPWRLGAVNAAAVTLDTASYVEVEISGAIVKLAIVN